MLDDKRDYFEYVDNFKKINKVKSTLIIGNEDFPKPAFTILIPTYKRKELLRYTIDSALNQIGSNDYEILIIDNDPVKGCEAQKLISSYSSKKLRYYKNDANLGMFGNWNRGFELARSKWVILVHDDDIISPYFLNYCSSYLTDKSIAILKPDSVTFSGDAPNLTPPKEGVKLNKITLIDFIWGCAVGAPTNIVFNREIVIELGGFNQDYYPTSDYVFSARCADKYPTYRLPTKLGGYRVEDNASLSQQTMNDYFRNRYLISSFIMKKIGFDMPFRLALQAYLVPKSTKLTNLNYQTNFKFSNADLGLQDNSKLVNFFIKFIERILFRIIKGRRVLSRLLGLISKNKTRCSSLKNNKINEAKK